jgi:hypothetical protein
MGLRFSAADIDHLRLMVAEGFDGNTIATILLRSPLSIRVKCCALGLRLRHEKGQHELRFQLTERTHGKLKEIAKARGTSPSRFVRLLVEVCVRDGLLEPIADRTAALSVILQENCRERPVRSVRLDKGPKIRMSLPHS